MNMKSCFHHAAWLFAAATMAAVSCEKPGIEPEPSVLETPVLTIENVTETSAMLTWTAVEGASGYALDIQGPDGYSETAEPEETEYELTGLEPETGYSARIMALASGDEHESSAWSEWQEFTTAGPMIADAFAGGSGAIVALKPAGFILDDGNGCRFVHAGGDPLDNLIDKAAELLKKLQGDNAAE